MNRKRQITLFIVTMIGIITPFIPSIIVIEMFFLLIPLGLVFLGTLTYLLVCIFSKTKSTKRAFFAFSIVPIFVLTQLLSGLVVDKIQKHRSQKIIADLHKLKEETGDFPASYSIPFGMHYDRLPNKKSFKLEYSRGFMVSEKFYSNSGKWESFGWND